MPEQANDIVDSRRIGARRPLAEPSSLRPAPTLICLGVNHRTADVETRERLQREWERLETELLHLRACTASRWRLLEWVLLETCNRFELYAAVEGQRWAFAAWLHSRLDGAADARDPHRSEARRGHDSVRGELGRSLYRRIDLDAVHHLFEVAAGIDSMVFGESEILGQVRRAARRAKEEGTLGEHLSSLFRAAVRTGRRVRQETEIARQRSTVSSVALARVEERLGPRLDDARVLVLGLGEIGQVTLGAVRKRGVGEIGVLNRTEERARSAADRQGLRWWSIDDVDRALGWADVVFTCASAPEPLITKELITEGRARAATGRGERGLLLVDLAVPRNVDPSCDDLEGVEVLAIDDLGAEAEEALRRRREALPQVHRVLARELEAFVRDGRLVAVEPTIKELRTWSDELRVAELSRLRRSLEDASAPVDEETWKAFEDFTRSLTDKLLHEPTTRLRASAAEGSGEELLRALRALFGIDRRRRTDRASG